MQTKLFTLLCDCHFLVILRLKPVGFIKHTTELLCKRDPLKQQMREEDLPTCECSVPWAMGLDVTKGNRGRCVNTDTLSLPVPRHSLFSSMAPACLYRQRPRKLGAQTNPLLTFLPQILYLSPENSDLNTILLFMKWYLIVILICISPMTNYIPNLFMQLSSICISSLEKCLLKSLAHFPRSFFVETNALCLADVSLL